MESRQYYRKEFINPLLTDFYQITMVYSLFKQNKHNQYAVYDAFFRKCPFKGEFTVFAGIGDVVNFLENFKFAEEHIEYLKMELHGEIDPKFFEWLSTVDASMLQVYAVKEGSLVFPNEPILRVEGPLALCQLVESTLLNLMNFPTLMATNALRMKMAAGPGKTCIEFGLRRAQGPDGAMMATQYSYLGGFDSTSNTLGGFTFGIRVTGTMAHAYIMSFDSLEQAKHITLKGINLYELSIEIRKKLELEHTNDGELASFIAYASDFPESFLALVDTYDTILSGVPNFIIVAFALKKIGFEPHGIRLDSGDLAALSIKSKQLMKKYSAIMKIDITHCLVVASNDINEEALLELSQKEHCVDSFGIGTNLVTCQKQPALGMVYKLVQLEDKYRIKLSEEAAKITLPGKKNIYRLYSQSSEYPILDVLTCSDEKIQEGEDILIRNMKNLSIKFQIKPTKAISLHTLIWNGKRAKNLDDLERARRRLKEEVDNFNPKILDLKNPQKYDVYLSDKLAKHLMEEIEKNAIIRQIN